MFTLQLHALCICRCAHAPFSPISTHEGMLERIGCTERQLKTHLRKTIRDQLLMDQMQQVIVRLNQRVEVMEGQVVADAYKVWAREAEEANRIWEEHRPFICGCEKRFKSQGDLDAHRESTGH